jgi:hypothetical protein
LSTPDFDFDRYLALLRDADDEPKRLALIQLLIDEEARLKLSAKREAAESERLPEPKPPVPLPQVSTGPDIVSREATLIEGGASILPEPQAGEVVVGPISDLVNEEQALAESAAAIPRHAVPKDEIELEISGLLKGLPRGVPSIVANSGNQEDDTTLAIRAAIEDLLHSNEGPRAKGRGTHKDQD